MEQKQVRLADPSSDCKRLNPHLSTPKKPPKIERLLFSLIAVLIGTRQQTVDLFNFLHVVDFAEVLFMLPDQIDVPTSQIL